MRKKVRYHGWLATLQIIFLMLIRKFMRFDRIHMYLLDKAPRGLKTPVPETTRFATIEEIHTLADADAYNLDRDEIGERLGKQHRCLINVLDGEIVGYNWMNPHEIFVEELDLGFELLPHEFYLYDAFTHPAFRGRRLGHDRLMFWLGEGAGPGKTTIVSDFAFDNKATLTRVDKFGYKYVGTITRIGIGRFRRVSKSGDFARRRMVERTTVSHHS